MRITLFSENFSHAGGWDGWGLTNAPNQGSLSKSLGMKVPCSGSRNALPNGQSSGAPPTLFVPRGCLLYVTLLDMVCGVYSGFLLCPPLWMTTQHCSAPWLGRLGGSTCVLLWYPAVGMGWVANLVCTLAFVAWSAELKGQLQPACPCFCIPLPLPEARPCRGTWSPSDCRLCDPVGARSTGRPGMHPLPRQPRCPLQELQNDGI